MFCFCFHRGWDDNLLIPFTLILLDRPRKLKGLCKPQNNFAQQKAENSLTRTMPKFPNIVYKCLGTFKGDMMYR